MDVEISISAADGNRFSLYRHNNQLFAMVPETGTYNLDIKNNSSERRLVVLSVDGLNVIDGQPASKDGQGYIIGPYQSTSIKGWYRTNKEVAAFEFTTRGESYSNQMGHGISNVGVIGAAVFAEKPAFVGRGVTRSHGNDFLGNGNTRSWGSQRMGSAGIATKSFGSLSSSSGIMDSAPVATASAAPSSGTGYGSKTEMLTSMVEFERGAFIGMTSIRYGVRAKLIEWGVPLETEPVPNPFPMMGAPAPSGWRG